MLLDAKDCSLLLVDLQERLMPAIHDGAEVTVNAGRLAEAAAATGVPVMATEQNAAGLGPTVGALAAHPSAVFAKTSFGATREPGFADFLPPRGLTVVAGCEAHVCVLQTVLGMLAGGRRVAVVADAVGSRVPANRDAGLARMRSHGAELVTTEMVVFEWLGTSEHPAFRAVQKLIK